MFYMIVSISDSTGSEIEDKSSFELVKLLRLMSEEDVNVLGRGGKNVSSCDEVAFSS